MNRRIVLPLAAAGGLCLAICVACSTASKGGRFEGTRSSSGSQIRDGSMAGNGGYLAQPREFNIGSRPVIIYDGQGRALKAPGSLETVQDWSTESYDHVEPNPFQLAAQEPLSTFSIDVDTASYSNVRRFLEGGQLPPAGAVRIEEMVNYFDYDYPKPEGRTPFSITTEVADCPWNGDHRLAMIGLQGREVDLSKRAPANLVFLIDTSGSMQDENKLPLVQESLRLLVKELNPQDTVSLVVYAGSAGLVLPPTSVSKDSTILHAIDRLKAGGSTNGGEGIMLAYETAQEAMIDGGVNRVVLCTDGDFNVGITDESSLVELVTSQASEGVFLSILGYGMGNYQDATMETLSNKGNGNYAYIDTKAEARKALVEEMAGTLITIAKDVKIQVEFNPAEVAAYRLIGYENRMLAAQDFNDDKKDAGDIGAGHSVTALYEIVPVGTTIPDVAAVDPLKYQTPPESTYASRNGEVMTVKLRYKDPDGDDSRLIERAVIDEGRSIAQASDDMIFAASVANFGMLLREDTNEHYGSFDLVLELARDSASQDEKGYRNEFLDLVKRARELDKGAS